MGRVVLLHWSVMIPDVSGAERLLSEEGLTGGMKGLTMKMMIWRTYCDPLRPSLMHAAHERGLWGRWNGLKRQPMIPVVVKLLDQLILIVRLNGAVGRELWMRGGLAAATFFLNGGLMMITVELGAMGENSLGGVVEIHVTLATIAGTGCRGCDLLTGSICPTWDGGAGKPVAQTLKTRGTMVATRSAAVMIKENATEPTVQTLWGLRRTGMRRAPAMRGSLPMSSELRGGMIRLGGKRPLCPARGRGTVAMLKFEGALRRLGGSVEGRPGLPANLATGVTWGEVIMASCRCLVDAKGVVEVAEG